MSQLQHKPDSKRTPKEKRARQAQLFLKEVRQVGAANWVNANARNMTEIRAALVQILNALDSSAS